MSALRVAAVVRRIIAQFRRDPRSLALLFVAPLAIIALLGWVLSGSGPPRPGSPSSANRASLQAPPWSRGSRPPSRASLPSW